MHGMLVIMIAFLLLRKKRLHWMLTSRATIDL